MADFATRVRDFFSGAATTTSAPMPVAYSEQRSAELPAEVRSLENPAVPLSQMTSWDDLTGHVSGGSHAGVVVTPDSAWRVSAVYACINTIASTIATIPIGVFKETKLGRDLDPKDPLQLLYEYGPDDFLNWSDFMYVLVAAALSRGNAYALIERDTYMKPLSIRFLEPGECQPIYVNMGRQRYLYYNVFGEIVDKRDIIHIRCLGTNGIEGKSPIELFANGIGLSLAAEEFGGRFFGQGAGGMGVLETGKLFKDQGAVDRLRKQFIERQTGLQNAHKPLILEDGMTYKQVTIPPNHAQFIETRNFQVEDIARMYNVPQHKIGKLDRSTNNNIEHQSKEFITGTILPWTVRIGQEFKRKLIAEAEKPSKEVVWDYDFLLRGDSVAQAAQTQALFNTGSITQNEIRRRNNLNRLAGLDDTFVQMNMQRVLPGSHMGAPDPASTTENTPPAADKTKPTADTKPSADA
jgi:HK97 family phage portal protein